MTDQTKHGIDFVQSSNKARMYEEKKKKEIPSYSLNELKISHDNHFVNQQMKMIKQELIAMINEKGNNNG